MQMDLQTDVWIHMKSDATDTVDIRCAGAREYFGRLYFIKPGGKA